MEEIPLQVRVLEGKVYVWRDFSGAPASLAGMEIRSLNGASASKILEKMLAAASGDGDIQTSRMWRISGWAFSSQLLALAGLSAPYDVALWDSKEKREIKPFSRSVQSVGRGTGPVANSGRSSA